MWEIRNTSLSFVLLLFLGYFLLIEYLENVRKRKDLARNIISSKVENWKTQTEDKYINNGWPEIDPKWQIVEGMINHKFYVYSAYYDVRPGINPAVRIIGVTRTKNSDAVTCRMYFEHDQGQDL